MMAKVGLVTIQHSLYCAIIPDADLGKRASCLQHLRWLNKSMVMRIFFRRKNDVSPSLDLPDYKCIWQQYHFSQLSHSASSSLQHFAMSSRHSFVFSICIVIVCPTFQMKMSQGWSECSIATRPTLWGALAGALVGHDTIPMMHICVQF